MNAQPKMTVVGIGDDGRAGLSGQALERVAKAQVLVGGERHLSFFPDFAGERVILKNGVATALDRMSELAKDKDVCILASGDPLFFGIGGLVVKKCGIQNVEILPAPSSIQWAFARVGLKWDDAGFLSFHGRPLEGFLTRLKGYAKAACFTDEENSPQRLAAHMVEHGETAWRAWVCENLGGRDERIRPFTAEQLAACSDVGPLNVLILVRTDLKWRAPASIPFLHEDAFAKRMPKKGLITKRETRLISLAQMAIRPDSVVWDVGAGSGSVSIEAALLAYEGKVFAVESDPEGVEICRENIKTHAVDNVHVIAGRAPEALKDLEDPDAVFVGGSKGSMEEIIQTAWGRLNPGGRLVVNAITLENVSEAYTALRSRELTPDIILLNVSRGEPLARYMRYEAMNPIQIFTVAKGP